jgi:hypothetical protein
MKNKILVSFVLFLTLFSIVASAETSFKKSSITLDKNLDNVNSYKYYTYDTMTNLLEDIQKNHSDIMLLKSIGKTYEGRDIWMVKISDNVLINENEPEVLFMGAHHGDEKISYEVLIYFIKYINDNCENPSDVRIRNIINYTEIYIVPMLNPDGVEANTRKNCAPNYGPDGKSPTITSIGVDLNRNYGYKWDLFLKNPEKYPGTSQDDSDLNYRGESAFCENETKAIRELVNSSYFVLSLSFHSCGGVVGYPWYYTNELTPDNKLYFSISRNISRIYNFKIQNLFMHLRSDIFSKLAHIVTGKYLGEADDWLYGEHNILAFTIELGNLGWLLRSFWINIKNSLFNLNLPDTGLAPVNSEDVMDSCYKTVNACIYVCEISKDLVRPIRLNSA